MYAKGPERYYNIGGWTPVLLSVCFVKVQRFLED